MLDWLFGGPGDNLKTAYHPLYWKQRSIQTQYMTARVLDRARAGPMVMVHGGERKRRSTRKTMEGMA